MSAKGEKMEKSPITTSESVPYRKIEALNYSSIVKFDKSPAKFVEEFIMGNIPDDEDTKFSIMGTLVDDIVLNHQGNIEEFEQHFDENYALYEGEPSTAQGFILAEELFRITKECIQNGECTRTFEDRFREAFEIVQSLGKYKGKTVEQGLDDFRKANKMGAIPESYFQTKLDNIGKTVVSVGVKTKGLQIASNALIDPFLKEYVNFIQNDKLEVLTKFPITFTYKGEFGQIQGKVEVDELMVDHARKTIQPIDWKTTYDNTIWWYKYVSDRYYIQAIWYTIAVVAWAMENGLQDYEILPYRFIVLDSSDSSRRPLIYQLNAAILEEGMEGFLRGEYRYKGVRELVEAIIWANTNGVWNISKKAYEADGLLKMEDFL